MTRYTQPQAGPFQIDWGNPITKGLIDVSHPFDGTWSISGTVTKPINKAGVALAGNGSSSYYFKNSAPDLSASTVTILGYVVGATGGTDQRLYSFGSSASNNSIVAIDSGAASAAKMSVWARDKNGGIPGSRVDTAATVFEAGVPHVGILTIANGLISSYVDGKADNTSTTTYAGCSDANRTAVGALLRASAGNFNGSSLLLGLTWNRVLSAAEIASISANPWQIFLDEDISFFTAPVSGNVSVTLASQIITSSIGIIGVTNSIPLSTQLSSTSYGNVSFEYSSTLTSQISSSSQGSISTSIVYSLTGQQVTSGVGTVTYSSGTNISVTLSSQLMSSSQGNLAFTNSIPLSGIDTTTSYGTVIPSVSFTLASQLSGTSQGSLNYSVGAFLTGQQANTTAGAITPTTTIGLLGKQMGVVAGTMTFSSGSGGAVWPLPSQVAYGVVYGPTGTEYVGTFIGNMTVEITTGALVKPLTPKLSVLL